MEAQPFFINVASSVVGLVFLAAGVAKARNVASLASTLRALGVGAGSKVAAQIVLTGEILVGLAFLLRMHVAIAAALAVALLVAFSAAAIWSSTRRLNVRCSCFGSAEDVLGTATLARCGLLALLLAGSVGSVENSDLWLRMHGLIAGTLLILLFSLTGHLYRSWQPSPERLK